MKKILIILLFLFFICFPVNSEIKILPIIEGNIDAKIKGIARNLEVVGEPQSGIDRRVTRRNVQGP